MLLRADHSLSTVVGGGGRVQAEAQIPRIRFGPVQPISLTTENWNAAEAAYGRSLSEEVRSQILQVTNQFLQFADAEKNIGDMDEAIQRAAALAGMRATSRQFDFGTAYGTI